MRITGLGHAGLFIETPAGSVLCDPWVSPAFFGSWFPFPDNSDLDWDGYGRNADYLYVSHLHRDHFDPVILRRHVRKDVTVLLPAFPTDELECELRGLGFTRFLRTRSGVPVERDGLRLMVTALTGPGDGPIGDSALSVDDGQTVLLNQNDAHPLDIAAIREFGEVHAHLLQFSGAIWWPMVYRIPDTAKRKFAERKRQGQFERAVRYIDALQAANVFPNSGPPCFLDDDLLHLNGTGRDGESIFTDQREFVDELARQRPDVAAHMWLPGSVAKLSKSECEVTHRYDPQEMTYLFEHKAEYLRAYARRRKPELAAERAGRAPALPRDELLAALKDWWEPLLARAHRICDGVGGPLRLDVGDTAVVVDFPARQVRLWDGERCRYTLSAPADLVATNIAARENDWSNSLLLSLRFSAERVGPYNEFVYTFFKCLSEERIDYVENYYASADDDGEDIVIDDWQVQRRCPHLRADLTDFGSVEDGVLTCALHGWMFDLSTGRCLTSDDHDIRAERTTTPAAVPDDEAQEAASGGVLTV
ncbi:Rieske 2Fe-2S domain-containing protein [Actinacidiphila acidipaludis]|uniref:Rieske 2Fe-2S domain-containing protein n=1 Tax=Actinacidiphila acidipaludis TaxID=2873382 RepID=A0ABS7Q4E4_9ACTN|nr:Rieske 2Fe-2S domain-containing protein [Streptomyces acidipaludis]MBY8878017.1 Rieske 2Fe-2S domain-containing protein [Streptomyces acidipaludis]